MRTTLAISSLFAATFLLGCGADKSLPTSTQPNVHVQTLAETNHYKVTREYVGMILSRDNANLGFEFSGKINHVSVNVGDQVIQGQKLASLNNQLLGNESEQFQARLDQINAQLALVKNNLKRQERLKTKGFSAEAEIDSLKSQRDNLLASRQELNIAIEANALRQEKSILHAPYAGQISKKFVSVGDVVNAGSPVLTLLSSGNKEAKFGVPISAFDALKNQTQQQIRVGDKIYTGQLLNATSSVDFATRTAALRYELGDLHHVHPGETAYLLQETEIQKNGFWVPLTSITDGLRGTWNVFVVVDKNGQSLVERRAITILHSTKNAAFVSGSLRDQDKLIVDGVHRIVSGQAVSTMEKSS